MENANAKVRVRSSITSNGETSRIDIKSEGLYYKEDDRIYIIYEEDDMIDLGCTKTKLCITPDGEVLVDRDSGVTVKMKYKKGLKEQCIYNLEFGVVNMQTDTKDVEVSLSDSGGHIKIDYILNIGGNKSEHTLTVFVKTIA